MELPDGREMHLAFARFMRREKPGRNLHHAVSFATAARPEGPYEVLKIAYGPHRPQGEDTGTRYDTAFVGTTSHPIETPVGYFNVPHAGAITFDGKVYRLGFQIFDLDHPTEEIIYDSYFPILVPETDYEFEGWVNNVVYSCCVIPNLEDNQLILYYGTADRYIGKLVVTLVKNWRELTKEDLAKMQREEFERIKGIKRQLEAIYKQDIAFLNGNGDGGKMTRAESPAAARASSSPISIDSTPDIIGTAA